MRFLRPLRGLLRAAARTRSTIALVPEALEAVLVLPRMVEQLERIERDTAVLPDMRDDFVVVRATVVRMQGNTAVLEDLAGAAKRIGRFSGRSSARAGSNGFSA